MKLWDVKMAKLTKVLYMPQAVKKLLSISRLASKGATMGATQNKTIIEKNGVSMILDARKGKKKYNVLLEGKEVLPRRTRYTHQSDRK